MTNILKVEIRRSTAFDQDASPDDGDTMDAERREAWNRDEWHYIGVRAEATVTIPSGINGGTWAEIVLHSPGLWAVESDSGEAYLNEIFAEEVSTLKIMIEAMRSATPEFIVHDPAVSIA